MLCVAFSYKKHYDFPKDGCGCANHTKIYSVKVHVGLYSIVSRLHRSLSTTRVYHERLPPIRPACEFFSSSYTHHLIAEIDVRNIGGSVATKPKAPCPQLGVHAVLHPNFYYRELMRIRRHCSYHN